MKTLGEALDWLYGTQWFGVKLGLEGVHRLAGELGVVLQGPGSPLFLHVAGTNGKGSTCAMVDSICRAAGRRCGLYTSPHLISITERFRLDGDQMTGEQLCDSIVKIRRLVEHWDPHPTFFEIVTVLGLEWFQRERAEIVVLETGLGGRLDATNVVTPAVSVLTPVGLDHQQYLGGTLKEIAWEKAGIIKPGVPVVSAPQPPEVREVFERRTRELNCTFRVVDSPYRGGVGLAGEVQRWNAALALASLSAADIFVEEAEVQQGLAEVQWPGRFQKVSSSLVLDGAHNPHAAEALAATWKQEFPGEKMTLIFGSLEDKDHAALLKALAPLVGEVIVLQVESPRALRREVLVSLVGEHLSKVPCRVATDAAAALALPAKFRRLATGSLYLVGEVLALIQKRNVEKSAQ